MVMAILSCVPGRIVRRRYDLPERGLRQSAVKRSRLATYCLTGRSQAEAALAAFSGAVPGNLRAIREDQSWTTKPY